jgi:3-hydroxy-9,10-secoandrosta-1,3,5(10)-triene-9,17-dione monooxygenase reductase component
MSATVPEGMNENARETWPSQELIKSWLGNELDFELRLGEHTPFCSGVTVITSMSEGQPVGMTCQSFSSVSLEPPLVMFSPAKTSRAWPLIQRAGFFCVNILASDQADLSNGMATKGDEKFKGVDWSTSTTGAPLLAGVLGYVDCTVHQVVEAGDHYVVIGRVKELAFGDGQRGDGQRGSDAGSAVLDPAVEPLLFFQGKYTKPE